MIFSGIITTTLGKTATFTKGAGRERRVHHSKSLPLLSIGERLFFCPASGCARLGQLCKKYLEINRLNSPFTLSTVRAAAPGGVRRRRSQARPAEVVNGGS